MNMDAPQGRLACVGLGMMLGAHLGPRARAHIEEAEVVFVAASDPVVEQWVRSLRPDARSLQPFYAEGKSRYATYREMVAALLAEVRGGRRVCAAFYGHPGVFARVPHEAIAQARAEGHEALMEPGVSAEDCLYADLAIDPGAVGCQHYEATQFLLYRRRIDPSAWLVLWQVGVVGDRACTRYATSPDHVRLLVERLLEDYPPAHEAIAYEAPTLPIALPRIERVPLHALPGTTLRMHTTLALPPARALQPDAAMQARLAALEAGIPLSPRPRPRLAVVPTPIPEPHA